MRIEILVNGMNKGALQFIVKGEALREEFQDFPALRQIVPDLYKHFRGDQRTLVRHAYSEDMDANYCDGYDKVAQRFRYIIVPEKGDEVYLASIEEVLGYGKNTVKS